MNSKKQYTRMIGGFAGIDVTSDDSNVDERRMPYAVNMWRDWESENGAAVETFPGYRRIKWTVEGEGRAAVHSLWGARFFTEEGIKEFLILHRGSALAAAPIDERDEEKTLTVIGRIADGDSKGFSFGGAFYILDGEELYRLSYTESFHLEAVGDGAGEAPSTNAYIPTTYSDGAEYEQRNMLTNYFFNKYNVNNPEKVNFYNGLKIEILSESEKTAAVVGSYPGITHLYIPSEVTIGDNTYRVTTIGRKAFYKNATVKTVIASKGVETVEDGAFNFCTALETVVLHGVKTIGKLACRDCHALYRVVLSDKLASIGAGAFKTGNTDGGYYYFEGTEEEAEAVNISDGIPDNAQLIAQTALCEVHAGEEFSISLPDASYTKYRILNGPVKNSVEYLSTDSEAGEALFKALQRVSWQGIAFTDDGETKTSLAVVTVVDGKTAISQKESSVGAYRFDILDPCRTVAEVSFNGTKLPTATEGGSLPAYELITETVAGKEYVRAVVLVIDEEALYSKEMMIKGIAYDGEFSRSNAGNDYTYDNGAYKGTSLDAIRKCTVWAEFDGRIFLTGNPSLPNTVFYSQRNLQGVNDPTYFGQLNYFNDGSGMTPNMSLLSTPSFLAVIKAEGGDGGIWYHTAEATELDLIPKIYPGVKGSAGVGSLGACANFRDDPVFLSGMGLEGISLSSVNSERGLAHRSTNADKWLLAASRFKEAQLAQWKGYLVIACGEGWFLADSRQTARHETGGVQYEWYYLNDMCEYEGQTPLYFFPSASPVDSLERKLTDMYYNGIRFEVKTEETVFTGEAKRAEPSLDAEGTIGTADSGVIVYYGEEIDSEGNVHYYLLDASGEMVGGTHARSTAICATGELLFFGSEAGGLFIVNTDKRGEAVGEEAVPADRIHRSFYTRDGRRYRSGFSTKKDSCGIPHLDKDTVRKSLVIKSKTMTGSRYTLKVRTDREGWEEVEIPTLSDANTHYIDFTNQSFMTTEETILPARESKRRWVEKQYYLESNGYMEPFGIYHMVYRYVISGLAGRIRR